MDRTENADDRPSDVQALRRQVEALQTECQRLRAAEQEIHEEHLRYRFLFEEGPTANAVAGLDGRLVEVNERFAQTLGYAREEMLGRLVTEFVHEDDRADVASALAEALQGRSTGSMEVRVVGPAGVRTLRFLGRFLPIRRDGEIVGVMNSAMDITDWRNSEEALRQNEKAERRQGEDRAALHEVTIELCRCSSTEELCRRAVELGRDRLGFERLGIWLAGDDPENLEGTCGVDEQGRLRDERGARASLKVDTPLRTVLFGKQRFARVEGAALYDHDHHVIGRGTLAAATVWDGDRIIGAVCADNLLTGRPFTDARGRLLEVYASSFGHLFRRVQTEAELRASEAAERRMRERWSLLHEVNIELSAIRHFDELCRQAVELARDRLGLDRVGLWFCTDDPDTIRGSFGTDAQGRTRDERGMVNRVGRGTSTWRIIHEKRRSVETGDAALVDDAGQIVVRGWQIKASLWDGQNVLGYIVADNLLTGRPMDREMRDTLALYAIGLGHLVNRARAEESLRQSESVARALINASTERALLLDVDGTILALNDTAARAFGMTQEEVVGRCVWNLMPEELVRVRGPVAEEAARTGRPQRFSDRRDGRWLDNSLHPVFDAEGRVVCLAVFARDVTEERAAAEALMVSERRYRGLFEDSPVCLWEEDFSEVKKRIDALRRRRVKDFRKYFTRRPEVLAEIAGLVKILDVNRATVDVYEAEGKEQLLRNLRAVFTGKSMAAFKEEIVALAEGTRTFETEGANRTLTGRKIDVVVKVSLAPGAEEDWSRAMVSVVDMTARKRAEEALSASERQLRDVLETSRDVIYKLNLATGRYDYVSPAVLAATGFSPEEFMNLSAEEALSRFHPDHRQRYGRHIKALLSGRVEKGFQPTIEYRWRRKDDTYRWFSDNRVVVRGAKGEPTAIVGGCRDITGRKEGEEALRQTRDRLQYVIDNTDDAIFEIDLEGNYTFAAKSGERLTGYSLSELIGMNMGRLAAPEFRQQMSQRLARRIGGEQMPQPFYFEIVHKDGHRIVLELTTTGVYRDGKLVAIQGIARDITERRRAEKALEEARARLGKAREAERRRLAGELHDSVGQGLVAMQLRLRGLLAEARGARLKQIDRMCNQCDTLIREVRQMCRGLYPTTLASLGLPAAVRQLASDFQGHPDVTVECSCAPGLKRFRPEVEIALFRIAQEAVSNAIRHGQAGKVQIGLSCEKGQVVLTVTDNGQGFKPDATEGSGVGLAMMRERMQEVGGRVEITSRRRRTRVVVTVPAQDRGR